MLPKLLCGFVVILVVLPVKSIHYQAYKFFKCLSQKKSKFKPGFLKLGRLNI